MGRFARPCLTCNQLTREGSYCREHKPVKVDSPERREKKKQLYNSRYRKQAKWIRETTETCWICGRGPIVGDPWQADHVNPSDPTSPLLGAHRSCNARRGNTPADQTR